MADRFNTVTGGTDIICNKVGRAVVIKKNDNFKDDEDDGTMPLGLINAAIYTTAVNDPLEQCGDVSLKNVKVTNKAGETILSGTEDGLKMDTF